MVFIICNAGLAHICFIDLQSCPQFSGQLVTMLHLLLFSHLALCRGPEGLGSRANLVSFLLHFVVINHRKASRGAWAGWTSLFSTQLWDQLRHAHFLDLHVFISDWGWMKSMVYNPGPTESFRYGWEWVEVQEAIWYGSKPTTVQATPDLCTQVPVLLQHLSLLWF